MSEGQCRIPCLKLKFLLVSYSRLNLRSHGALCMCTAVNMADGIAEVLYGGGKLGLRTRIHCTVKSTFSETRLVPALNDLLIANPSPAAVSRFRMGWLEPLQVDKSKPTPSS